MPCERKTRRRSITSPAGPTSGNSALQGGSITRCGEEIQGGQVPLEAEARDHAFRRRGRHHPMPIRLAGKDVGNVNFDNQLARAAQCIGERQAGVRERPGGDDDGVARCPLLLDPVDQLALVVRLQARNLELELTATLGEQLFQVGEGLRAVELRHSPPEGGRLGSFEYKKLHAGSTSASDASSTDGSTNWPYSARPISRSRNQRNSPARDFLSWRIASMSFSCAPAGGSASRPASRRRECCTLTLSGAHVPVRT